MGKCEEAKIRREGFSINSVDAKHLLAFIEFHDKRHVTIEAEIVVKLELLSRKITFDV